MSGWGWAQVRADAAEHGAAQQHSEAWLDMAMIGAAWLYRARARFRAMEGGGQALASPQAGRLG